MLKTQETILFQISELIMTSSPLKPISSNLRKHLVKPCMLTLDKRLGIIEVISFQILELIERFLILKMPLA